MLLTYVRWQPGKPRKGRVLPPLERDHAAYRVECPMCLVPLGGDSSGIVLVAIGPNSDEDFEKHQAGRVYSAQALVFHARCVGDDVSIRLAEHDVPAVNEDGTCPRCGRKLDAEVMQPVICLRMGPNGERLAFHAPCLGIPSFVERAARGME